MHKGEILFTADYLPMDLLLFHHNSPTSDPLALTFTFNYTRYLSTVHFLIIKRKKKIIVFVGN
jgi:hypothetical protein